MPYNGKGYYVVMTDNNTKYGNIGSNSEFQDGREVLNNTRLNHIYHNEGFKPMNNYLFILKVKIWQEMLVSVVSMAAILNSKLTKIQSDLSVSSLDFPSSKTRV